MLLWSSLFRGSTASYKEYTKIITILNSSKYSSSKLYSHETDFFRLQVVHLVKQTKTMYLKRNGYEPV